MIIHIYNLFFAKKNTRIENNTKIETYKKEKIEDNITDMIILEESQLDDIKNMSHDSLVEIILLLNRVNNSMIYVLTDKFDEMDDP